MEERKINKKKKRLESKMERQELKNTEGERGKKNFDEIDHTQKYNQEKL